MNYSNLKDLNGKQYLIDPKDPNDSKHRNDSTNLLNSYDVKRSKGL